MKLEALALFFLALSPAAFGDSSIDPRLSQRIREELSTNRSFCSTFVMDGSGGAAVAMDCGHVVSDRLAESLRIPTEERASVAIFERDQADPNGGLYCRELGEYAGGFVGEDCDAWNRERSELVTYAVDRPTPTASERAEIERRIANKQADHARICRSLQMAGSRGRGDIGAARIQACLASAALAERTDRALFLDDYPLN